MKNKKLLFNNLTIIMITLMLSACGAGTKTPAAAGPEAGKEVKNEIKTEPKKEPQKTIRISNGLNEEHPMYLGSKKFADIINSKSNGRFKVEVFANATLGDDVKATDSVRSGTLEMVVTALSPLASMNKQFNIFDFPFLFPNEKAADAVMDGEVGQKIASSLEPHGLKLLAYFENGFRQVTNSVREIKSPDDMKGLKIRAVQNPLHLATFKALGANPTPMPFSEVFTAMESKTIDGQENPIPTIYLSKFYEVQKYVTLTGHLYGPHVMLINGKLWNSLSAEDKKMFEDAANEAKLLNRSENRKMDKQMVEQLRKAGMKVTELSPEQSKAFQDAVQPVYKQFEGEVGKELIDSVQAVVAKAAK
jgi:tripartite ATP-independent transporter DctP family solute receptor